MGILIRLTLAVAAVAAGAGAAAVHTAQAGPEAGLTGVTVAMGYIPDAQFAPYYVAESKGYYRAAGLRVQLRYGIEPDVLQLVSQGRADFAISGGDEVLAAGVQGLRVRYVMTQYSRFPSALFALRSSGITRIAGLRGKTIGIPGKYGASYVGLLTLLDKAGIPRSAVTIQTIGYTQVPSVAHHKVDAAVGFAMNEPLQLRQQGYRVTEFDVWRWANIAGAGIAAGTSGIARRPAIVRAFVQATLHGLADTVSNPDAAFTITENTVPALRHQARFQRAELKRAVAFWQAEPGHRLGWVDPAVWSTTARLLYRYGQIKRQASAQAYYTNRFIP